MKNDEKVKKNKKERFSEIASIAKAGVRLHKYAFKNSPYVSLGLLILTVILAISPFIDSWLNKLLIDILVDSVSSSEVPTVELIHILILYVVIIITTQLLSTFLRYLKNIQDHQFGINITMTVLKKYSTLDFEYYENSEFNNLIKKASEGYMSRPNAFLMISYNLINDVIRIITSLLILASFSFILIPIIIITQLPEFLNQLFIGRRRWSIWDADAETRRRYGHTVGYLQNEGPLTEIKIFKIKQYLIDYVEKLLKVFKDKEKTLEKKRTKNNFIMDIIGGIGFGLSIWIITAAAFAGRISVGSFTFYLGTVNRFTNSITSFLFDISRMYENGLYLVELFKVLDVKPLIVNGTIKLPSPTTPPRIEFKNIKFKYTNASEKLFTNLNFTIKPGENIAIVGANGAGKTSFVKLLTRFYDVTDGEILIGDINIKSIDIESWYSYIALLSQDFVRYHFSARDNIALGNVKKKNDLEKIIEAAKLSDAHDFIEKLDNKYEQILDKRFEKGTNLSTGQWQKIALARAFFKDAPILILDEPTSAIDPKSEAEIFDKLFDYAKEKTVIIISHRFSTVRNASRIIVLDEGQIIEQGTHEELMKLNGQYKHAFELQRKGFID